jgi:hypothetical protein
MRHPDRVLRVLAIAGVALAAAASAGMTRDAAAALPPGNTVAQWNKIAEDTVVGSGAFQSEGFIYMAYASTAVYNAVVAIEGGYEPVDSTITSPVGASVDCAVVEAAYRTLRYYFSSLPAERPANGHIRSMRFRVESGGFWLWAAVCVRVGPDVLLTFCNA